MHIKQNKTKKTLHMPTIKFKLFKREYIMKIAHVLSHTSKPERSLSVVSCVSFQAFTCTNSSFYFLKTTNGNLTRKLHYCLLLQLFQRAFHNNPNQSNYFC